MRLMELKPNGRRQNKNKDKLKQKLSIYLALRVDNVIARILFGCFKIEATRGRLIGLCISLCVTTASIDANETKRERQTNKTKKNCNERNDERHSIYLNDV